jgi:hypothetical protein
MVSDQPRKQEKSKKTMTKQGLQIEREITEKTKNDIKRIGLETMSQMRQNREEKMAINHGDSHGSKTM